MIAETKRQMHETLEMKEEEISQLRVRIQQCTGQREDLLEQKEKSDRAGKQFLRCDLYFMSISFGFPTKMETGTAQ